MKRARAWLVVAVLLSAVPHNVVHADWYVGLETAHTKQSSDTPADDPGVGYPYIVDDTDSYTRPVIGWRGDQFFIEASGGGLGYRRSENHNFRRCVGCLIVQEIETKFLSFGGGKRWPFVEGVHLVSMLDVVYVVATNVEYGTNENGAGQYHRNVMREFHPRAGVGLDVDVGRRVTVRISYSRLNDIAVSYWSGSNDVRSYAVMVGVRL